MANKFIVVRTQFESLHCWPSAPGEVWYLSHLHRHLFKVSMELRVLHGDRDLEFHAIKAEVDRAIVEMLIQYGEDIPSNGSFGPRISISMSCEDMAEKIFVLIRSAYQGYVRRVVVSEDGEFDGVFEP